MINLRKEAKGRPCQVRIPGYCTHDPAETVLAHVRMGTGAGQKPIDLLGTWACSRCHDVGDGREQTEYTHDEVRLMMMQGMYRTITVLAVEGIVTW